MNVYLPNLRLPSEYQEVEYIQSNGNQYIQTSIIPSNTKGIYIKLSSQDVTTDLIYIGSRNGTDTRFRIGNAGDYDGDSIYFGWNTINFYSYISSNTIYEVKMNYLNSRKEECNGTTVLSSIGTLSSSSTYPIYIFAGNDKGSTLLPSKIKLYSLKISDGSNVVNNFVPCYRKSDSVIGLYDLVNNQFYTNSGTGTFSKGNDVTMAVLKNAYIGEVIHKYIDVRGKTLTQIQAEGWGLYHNNLGYTLDSNGLTVSEWNASASLSYNYNLSSANKLNIKYTGYCTSPQSTSYGGGVAIGIGNNGQNIADRNFLDGLCGRYQTGYDSGGYGTNIMLDGTALSSQGGKNVGGNIDVSITINLSNGLCRLIVNSPVQFDTNITLTSSQLSQIKQYGCIGFNIWEATRNYYVRLYTAEFTIE